MGCMGAPSQEFSRRQREASGEREDSLTHSLFSSSRSFFFFLKGETRTSRDGHFLLRNDFSTRFFAARDLPRRSSWKDNLGRRGRGKYRGRGTYRGTFRHLDHSFLCAIRNLSARPFFLRHDKNGV